MPLKSTACCRLSSPRLIYGCRYNLVWRNVRHQLFLAGVTSILFLFQKMLTTGFYIFLPKWLTVGYKIMKTWQNLHLHFKTCIFIYLHLIELAKIYTDSRLWLHTLWNAWVNLYLLQVNCIASSVFKDAFSFKDYIASVVCEWNNCCIFNNTDVQ